MRTVKATFFANLTTLNPCLFCYHADITLLLERYRENLLKTIAYLEKESNYAYCIYNYFVNAKWKIVYNYLCFSGVKWTNKVDHILLIKGRNS